MRWLENPITVQNDGDSDSKRWACSPLLLRIPNLGEASTYAETQGVASIRRLPHRDGVTALAPQTLPTLQAA